MAVHPINHDEDGSCTRDAGGPAAEPAAGPARPIAPADAAISAALPAALWQRAALAGAVASVLAGVIRAPAETVALMLALATLPALAMLVLRVAALAELDRAPVQPPPVRVRAPPSGSAPFYTLLVPLYREERVVGQLVAALDALDYPRDRIEALLLVEACDEATRAAIARCPLPSWVRLVVVPAGTPRTKPRALNHGLALARGELVVVYDAEDAPEADQLARAAAAFRAGGRRLGCVQAALNIYNPEDGWLARQFAIEYSALFDAILPALERHRLTVMLGGTSNHFRRAILDEVGGWDPCNVTEDADLGLRLARRGLHVGILRSTTWEEAPATYRVWSGQRGRWLKGWMQTWIAHMRQPCRAWRELGAWRFLGLQALTGGVILSALVHPWCYVAMGWLAADGALTAAGGETWELTILIASLVNLGASYAAAIVLGRRAARRRGHPLGGCADALLLPIYWLLISAAAYRAVGELVRRPFHWQKTEHRGRPRAPRMAL